MVAITRIETLGGTPVAKAPEPDMGHAIIPKDRYISPAFMALEWERMWTKVWLVGCREEEIPETGDYVTTTIGTESLLIVRGESPAQEAVRIVRRGDSFVEESLFETDVPYLRGAEPRARRQRRDCRRRDCRRGCHFGRRGRRDRGSRRARVRIRRAVSRRDRAERAGCTRRAADSLGSLARGSLQADRSRGRACIRLPRVRQGVGVATRPVVTSFGP